MASHIGQCWALVLSCLLVGSQAFYLPGVAPQDFAKVCKFFTSCQFADQLHSTPASDGGTFKNFPLQKDPLDLKTNKLSSVKTQLPFEYYSLPYCRPSTIVHSAENLGEVLRGDRIENSLYQV